MARLRSIFKASPAMRDRLMYGSDWLMLAILPKHDEFRQGYQSLYDEAFREPVRTERFMGGAALSFLGFDDPTNPNNQRLRARYLAAVAETPTWLASPDADARHAHPELEEARGRR